MKKNKGKHLGLGISAIFAVTVICLPVVSCSEKSNQNQASKQTKNVTSSSNQTKNVPSSNHMTDHKNTKPISDQQPNRSTTPSANNSKVPTAKTFKFSNPLPTQNIYANNTYKTTITAPAGGTIKNVTFNKKIVAPLNGLYSFTGANGNNTIQVSVVNNADPNNLQTVILYNGTATTAPLATASDFDVTGLPTKNTPIYVNGSVTLTVQVKTGGAIAKVMLNQQVISATNSDQYIIKGVTGLNRITIFLKSTVDANAPAQSFVIYQENALLDVAKSFIWLAGTQNQETGDFNRFGGIGFDPLTMKVWYNYYNSDYYTPNYNDLQNAPAQAFNKNSVLYETKANFALFTVSLSNSNNNVIDSFTANTNTTFTQLYNTLNSGSFNYGDYFSLSFNPEQKTYPFNYVMTINAVNGIQPICNSPGNDTVQNVEYGLLKTQITPNGFANTTNELINNYGYPQYETITNLPYSNEIPESDYRSMQGNDSSNAYTPSFVGSVYKNPFYVNPENGAPVASHPFDTTTDAEMQNFLSVTGNGYSSLVNIVNNINASLKKENITASSSNYDQSFLRALTYYIHDHFDYNGMGGGYNATQTLADLHGVCFNEALAFAEVASYVGFPCSIITGAAFSGPNLYVNDQGQHAGDSVYNPQLKQGENCDPTWGLFNVSTTSGKLNRANQYVSVTLGNSKQTYASYFTNNAANQGNDVDTNAFYMQGGVFNQYFMFRQQYNETLFEYIVSLFRQID